MAKLLLLTNKDLAPALQARIRGRPIAQDAQILFSLDDLERAAKNELTDTFLLSFGTGVVVPRHILERFEYPPVNIHPAPPDYPGRDPHHFAAYDSADEFGATAHFMTARVDEGAIIEVERGHLEPGRRTPADYFHVGESAGMVLFERVIDRLEVNSELLADPNLAWRGRKTARTDFHTLCRVSPTIDADELDRRLNATHFPGYNNLVIELHNKRFRLVPLDGSDPLAQRRARWAEFTERGYRDLLQLAKHEGYRFERFGSLTSDRHVLWRHDVDYSVGTSLKLARIEADESARSTFFFCMHLPFYSMLERTTRDQARGIIALGHDAGLHFDASFYQDDLPWSLEVLEKRIAAERDHLQDLLGRELTAVSFHDPTAGNMIAFDQELLGGLVNTYGRRLKDEYGYCSDSNGYWRHASIGETIKAGADRLQILTHPAWWTPEPLPPRWRIEKVAMDRARATMAEYDGHLAASARENID